MIPELQAVITAINELSDRLESDAPPAVCLPMSHRVQQQLAALPCDPSEVIPLELALALERMCYCSVQYRARGLTKLIVGDATRQ